MHPTPLSSDQAKQRALAWALYLVTGQQKNLTQTLASPDLPRATVRALRDAVRTLDSAEWQIREELSRMVRRSLKGL